MKKIFTENDKFDRVLYSEQYIVKYHIKNTVSGYWEAVEKLYFAAGKNAHKAIEAKFKKEFPNAKLHSINYC